MARKTYIKDDWDDNALTGRSNPKTGAFTHPNDKKHAGDVLVGMYRPEWTVENGSPSATNQELQLPDGAGTNQHISIRSVFTTGSWSMDVEYATTGGSGYINWYWMALDKTTPNANDGMKMFIDDPTNANLHLEKFVGGTGTILIDTTWSGDGVVHTYKPSRDSYGNYELLVDGTSKGTVSDTDVTESTYFWILTDGDDEIHVDNLTVK